MKRFLALLLSLLFALTAVSAQVKVTTGSPDVDVKVKRAIVKGDNVLSPGLFSYYKWYVVRQSDAHPFVLGEIQLELFPLFDQFHQLLLNLPVVLLNNRKHKLKKVTCPM